MRKLQCGLFCLTSLRWEKGKKGESEIFDSSEKAKEYYKGFTSLYEGSQEKREKAGVNIKEIKFEKVLGKVSFGDESGLYKVTHICPKRLPGGLNKLFRIQCLSLRNNLRDSFLLIQKMFEYV